MSSHHQQHPTPAQPDATHRITRLEAAAYAAVLLLTILASAAKPWGFALPI